MFSFFIFSVMRYVTPDPQEYILEKYFFAHTDRGVPRDHTPLAHWMQGLYDPVKEDNILQEVPIGENELRRQLYYAYREVFPKGPYDDLMKQ